MKITTKTPWYWCKTCKKKTRHYYLYAHINDFVCEKCKTPRGKRRIKK